MWLKDKIFKMKQQPEINYSDNVSMSGKIFFEPWEQQIWLLLG